MIRLEDVAVTYAGSDRPAIRAVDLVVPEGELCLVVGSTGSGKSTLLRTVNGLVPHFSGGTLSGRVVVDGRDTATHPPRELADVVGFLGQDPLAGFVTDLVEDELAYAMESIGLPPAVMRRRVEETLDLLGLADLRGRALRTLSGGERQRVAIGSVLTAHPRVLVLDEPTSALDPGAAEEVLAALQRLVHDLGLTVLMAEHRLERVVQYADRVVRLHADERPPQVGSPADVMATSSVAPAVVRLGRLAGWDPLPLSVRDARRAAGPLRARLDGREPRRVRRSGGAPVATVDDLTVRFGATPALTRLSLTLAAGQVVALMGRNGAGKSTLLAALVGTVAPTHGRVRLRGSTGSTGSAGATDADPAALRGADLLRTVGLVPQEPGDLLYGETVALECAAADRDASTPPGSTQAVFDRLCPGVDPKTHPRDLSEGQRLTLALAVVLVASPSLVLLDEPTRGLDYEAKARLVVALRDLADAGHAVVLATHDVELAAEVADRTVVVAEGEVVSDGPTAEVVVGSPAFSTQVAKVLGPGPWLTVDEVASALAEAG